MRFSILIISILFTLCAPKQSGKVEGVKDDFYLLIRDFMDGGMPFISCEVIADTISLYAP